MAKLSADGKSVTVEKGDTLSEISEKYFGGASKYKQLAAINNLSNPNLIRVGQVIKLSSSGSSSTSTSSSSTNAVTINQFGLQSDVENTLFVTWSWSKESNTEHYEVKWEYYTADKYWFVGTDSTTKYKYSTFDIPENAKQIRVKIRPISKKKSNNSDAVHWTADWKTSSTFNINDVPPEAPPTPTVKIEKFKLTATVDGVDDDATHVVFEVIKDNKATPFNTSSTIAVSTGHASYSCNINAGGEYKVRCRSYRGGKYSDWSAYSSNLSTVPSAPGGITVLKALSESSIHIEWEKVATAESYKIEYTTKKIYFDSSNEVQSASVEAVVTHAELTGLETGEEYFFRVRATNDQGDSAWTEIKSIIIGKAPAAPTTWSSTTTAITSESVTLYWVHNSEDGSSQTFAELELNIGGVLESHTIENTSNEDEKDKTKYFVLNTSSYAEGSKVEWRVRTSGITKTFGDWSIMRTIDVYAPPTLELSVTDKDGHALGTLTTFPFYVKGLAGPNTQAPIGYHLSVIASESYDTVDNVGNSITINQGASVYSKYFDTTDNPLLVELSANNVDLQNGISYTVKCVASMNSGLTAESSVPFVVNWTDVAYIPNAEIAINKENFTAQIKPYCTEGTVERRRVVYDSETGVYTVTDTAINGVYGDMIDGAYTATGEQVYFGMTADGYESYYCMVETSTLVEGVILSVYRREFDGTFTELMTGIDNTQNTHIVDPHPALDYARYRIVAITESTGAVGYYDVPGQPVGGKAVIIQWDEAWSSFDTTNDDPLEQPPWTGSLLQLPYNVDVSDQYGMDVELVEYIGRKRPVSYYGTQLGESSTWNMVIEKDDVDTLYALRRLAIWPGDVYVREPSGSGYWANVTVSFSQKHAELTIPVSLKLVRVEGGI